MYEEIEGRRRRAWPAQPTRYSQEKDERPHRADLRRVIFAEVPLTTAFPMLALYQEEQVRRAADLLERETWAVAAILAVSGPIWSQFTSPTLCFPFGGPGESPPYHLEVGYFAHLAALDAPTAAERELIAATAPCWARVYPHQDRQRAGQSGALACSYVPVPLAEAVAALGLERILAQLETATRAAGQVLLNQAEAQDEREARLLRAERALDGESAPVEAPVAVEMPVRTRLVLALLEPGSRTGLALGAAFVGFALLLLFVLVSVN
ncbi:MAG TPA: hypothetical protein VNL71_21570 [Chloroflexota bacterium]|nr:hypothetical protein [Chloroflexota bacterium]